VPHERKGPCVLYGTIHSSERLTGRIRQLFSPTRALAWTNGGLTCTWLLRLLRQSSERWAFTSDPGGVNARGADDTKRACPPGWRGGSKKGGLQSCVEHLCPLETITPQGCVECDLFEKAGQVYGHEASLMARTLDTTGDRGLMG
jgi:hypothetical protein